MPRVSLHLVSALIGAAAIVAGVFLPWVRIGDVALAGIPDPAGLFVLGLGVACAVVTLVSAILRRPLPNVLMLAGIAAVTTLVVVWRTAPGAIGERALARAQAVALVDNVPVAPVPPIQVGAGVYVGMAGALGVVFAGLIGRSRPSAGQR